MTVKKRILLTSVLPAGIVFIILFIAGDSFTGAFEKKWINAQVEKNLRGVKILYEKHFSILRSPEREMFTALIMKMYSWGELSKFFLQLSPLYPQLEKISVAQGGKNVAGISKSAVNSFGSIPVNKKTNLSDIFYQGELSYVAFELQGANDSVISGIIELSSLFEKAGKFSFSPAGTVKFYSRPVNLVVANDGGRKSEYVKVFPLLNGNWSVEFTDDFKAVYKLRANFRSVFILFAAAVFFLMCIISMSYARKISFRLNSLCGDGLISGGEDEISVRLQISSQEAVGILGKNVSIIGHEFRNPIAAIKNAQFFILSQLPGEIKDGLVGKHLLIIKNEVKLISSMVEDLLTLSRVKPPVYVPCEVNTIIREAVDLFLADTRLIDFNVKLGEIPTISADVSEIKQVFLNVIRNACEAITPPGEIRIETGEQGDFVKIRFNDTGCGIPSDKQDEIWKPFVSTKSSGMGFGLSTVKRIVEERHKGKAELLSKPGKGTEIIIYLPKKQE